MTVSLFEFEIPSNLKTFRALITSENLRVLPNLHLSLFRRTRARKKLSWEHWELLCSSLLLPDDSGGKKKKIFGKDENLYITQQFSHLHTKNAFLVNTDERNHLKPARKLTICATRLKKEYHKKCFLLIKLTPQTLPFTSPFTSAGTNNKIC